MRQTILKRLLLALPLLFALPLLTLLIMHMIPGNYFDSMRMNPQISEDVIATYEASYHLDKHVLVQYVYWVKNLLRLDLGYSFAYHQPVVSVLASRLVNTLLLTVTAFLLAWLLAIPCGLWAGLHPRGSFDRLLTSLSYAGLSLPNFFLCLLLLFGATFIPGIPLGGMRSVNWETLSAHGRLTDIAKHLMIPVSVLALGSWCLLFRLMRAQTLDVAKRDFVFNLHALRVPKRRIVYVHIARNAINPMISLFGLELPALFSGAALVEIFTGWPGLGTVMLQAVRSQDLFLVLGNLVLVAILLTFGNLLADILLAAVDPRIRARASSAS